MLVEIYGMNNCVWCDRAVALAEMEELPFTYMLLDKDYKAEDLMEKFPGTTSLPQIMINGIHIGGYSDFEEVMEMSKE
jgi:glutaredoxin 3